MSAYDLGPRGQRVLDSLRERIKLGEFDDDPKLPSHTELAKAYGVAPMTVRHALSRLEEEGLIARMQGRGTFVQPRTTPAVLVVEDDPHIARLLAVHVQQTGVDPIVAASVPEAEAALAGSRTIVFVLCDVRLPLASDGLGLIQAIRRRHPDLPVAAVTAFPADLAPLYGTEEAPVLVIPKPFRASQIREALRLALRVPGTAALSAAAIA